MFKIFALLESVWNLLQNPYDNSHLTLGILLHYLGKLELQIFCRYWRTRRPASADRTGRRQSQTAGQPVSRTQASDAMASLLRAMRRSVCNAGASNGGRSLCVQISVEQSYPLPIYWYHSKGNWLRYNFAADSFYIGLMKLCSRLFVLYCRNCPKDDKFW